MTKKTLKTPAPWLTKAAAKAITSEIGLRREIEDYYGITGYTTVNTMKTRRSKKLLHPAILKLIKNYTGLSEIEIYNPAGHE